jgi:hypothetical protein
MTSNCGKLNAHFLSSLIVERERERKRKRERGKKRICSNASAETI